MNARTVILVVWLMLLGLLSACASQHDATVIQQPSGPAVGQLSAILQAAECVDWETYDCSSSTLMTVAPYGAQPRRVWQVTLENGPEATQYFSDHVIVWVDATTGEAEHVPCD